MAIKRELEQLAEMQYRKGFEAGFEASENNKTNLEKVKKWKFAGFKNGYKTHESPITGACFMGFVTVLELECKAINLTEILKILRAVNVKKSNSVEVLSIVELNDNTLEVILNNAESFSNSEIKEIIEKAFEIEEPENGSIPKSKSY